MDASYACCHRVPPAASSPFRNRPLFPRRSYLTIAFFFLSLLLDRTERAFAPGTRLLPDREAIDRTRARWLPPKGQPNGPTWRDRISIFHRARLRITCPCASHATSLLRTSTSLCAWRLENYMLCDVWILRREQFLLLAGASCEVKARAKRDPSFDLSLRVVFKRTRDRISFKSDETKVHKWYDWQLSVIGIDANQSLFSAHSILIFISAYRNTANSRILFN